MGLRTRSLISGNICFKFSVYTVLSLQRRMGVLVLPSYGVAALYRLTMSNLSPHVRHYTPTFISPSPSSVHQLTHTHSAIPPLNLCCVQERAELG